MCWPYDEQESRSDPLRGLSATSVAQDVAAMCEELLSLRPFTSVCEPRSGPGWVQSLRVHFEHFRQLHGESVQRLLENTDATLMRDNKALCDTSSLEARSRDFRQS